jgi:hypothetical protein
MTTFDDLPDELVEYIYKLVHKSRIENVHKELHSAFQVVYRIKFAALKCDEEIEAYMEEYEEEEEVHDDTWYEINKINEKFDKITDKIHKEHSHRWQLLKVLRFEGIDYLINNCNNHDLKLWWDEYEYESDEDGTENNEVVAEPEPEPAPVKKKRVVKKKGGD